MNKKIEFNYDGVDYTLEYNREAIMFMESKGLDISKVASQPFTMISILWQGAFFKNHRKEKNEIIEKIYDGIGNKSELNAALSEMFLEAYSVLIGDSDETDDTKNIKWKMS